MNSFELQMKYLCLLLFDRQYLIDNAIIGSDDN